MGVLADAVSIFRGHQPAGVSSVLAPRGGERATSWYGSMSVGDQGVQLERSELDFSVSAVAYRCVWMTASALASVDMVVYEGDEAREDDEVARLWNVGGAQRPGEVAPYSARVVREVAFARAELFGQSFTYIDRGESGAGPAVGLHPIYHKVEVVIEKDRDSAGNMRATNGRVTGFILTTPRGGKIPLLPSEVLWLRYPHPTDPWGALAPWRAAMYAVETDAYARAWQRAEFKNGARPSQVIDLGTVTPEQYNQAVAAVRTRVDGAANAGRSMIVGSDQPGKSPAKVQHLSLTPAEMSYLESRVANSDEVMLAFGINPDLMRPGSTYENRAAAKTAWWSETLLGKLDTAASEFDRQLVPELDRAVGWDLSTVDALRESQNDVIKRASDATYPDLVMIDEGRAMMGLDPLPNGAGQYTLTAYRERQRLSAQADFAALLGLAAGEVGRVGQAPVHRVRGRMINPRAAARAKKKPRGEATTLAHYERHERIGKRALRRLAERQEKAVLRQLKSRAGGNSSTTTRAVWPDLQGTVMPHPGGPAGRVVAHDTGQRMAAADLLDAPYWTAETVRMLEDFMDGTWADGGQYTADLFGLSWDHLDPNVTAAMTDRLNVLAGQITATTQAALEAQILQSGVEAGESIDDLARRLRGVFSDLSTWRAETIARTETVGGYNAAALMSAQSSGVVVSRSWLATADERTRPSHQRQNGHTVTGDDSYPNGCRFPGDPSGPSRETINCRCVELYATGPS